MPGWVVTQHEALSDREVANLLRKHGGKYTMLFKQGSQTTEVYSDKGKLIATMEHNHQTKTYTVKLETS